MRRHAHACSDWERERARQLACEGALGSKESSTGVMMYCHARLLAIVSVVLASTYP